MTNSRPSLDTLKVPDTSNQRSNSSHSARSSEFSMIVDVETLAAPDGGVSQNTAELLSHAFRPTADEPRESETEPLLSPDIGRRPTSGSRPWYKKASPWWILPFTSFSAFVFSSTIAPRTQIYIQLACEQHRPELYFTTPRVIGISDWSNGNLSAEIRLPSHPQGYGTFEEMKPVRSFTNDVVLNFAGHDEGPPRKILTKRPSSTNPRCNKDPIVLAAVARIVTVTALIVGILTCLTAPWWGELSDAYGRRRILMFTTLGVLFSESNLILVSFLHSSLPGGYWFLVLSSILDGAFGGLATASATTHAYLADCTEPSSRSKYFSMYTGILFTGIAAGPSFGSLLVSYTDDLLMVFYLALGVHIMLLLFIWTVLPESISPETIQALAEEREERVKAREQERIRARAEGSTRLNRLAGLAAFLRPLRIFLPKSRPNGQPGKDWNLFCLVIVYGIMTTYLAMFQYKSQYAIAVFGWNAEQLGYWLSAFGFARAAHLIVVLPVIINLLKPKVQPISLDDNTRIPSDTEQPTHSRQSSPSTYPAPAGLPPRIAAQFDLTIARVSILVDVVAYLAISVSVAQSTFWWSSIMASLGGGLIPAIQSLALVLTKDEKHEPGRVFGALSMVQALGSQIVGPAVFGAIYINTVATFPRTIFIVVTAATTIGLMLLLLIRLDPGHSGDSETAHQET